MSKAGNALGRIKTALKYRFRESRLPRTVSLAGSIDNAGLGTALTVLMLLLARLLRSLLNHSLHSSV